MNVLCGNIRTSGSASDIMVSVFQICCLALDDILFFLSTFINSVHEYVICYTQHQRANLNTNTIPLLFST